MKVILTNTVNTNNYSVEAGLHDGIRHFDHHGAHAGNPSPANNQQIQVAPADAVIQITHIDADTFLGVARLMGKFHVSKVDMNLLEQVDLNGSSVVQNKMDYTLCFMVGVGAKARELKFPRCSDQEQDVTDLIDKMFDMSEQRLVDLGRASQEKAEKAYLDCRIAVASGVGIWSIGPEDQLDPSRPYEDNIDVVVVYRQHYKSISIYCKPTSIYSFAGKEVGGIMFAGHPKACGSPRGAEMTVDQAMAVYQALV